MLRMSADGALHNESGLITRPRPITLKFLPIMLLSIAQKGTHYAQKDAHIILRLR